jgi:Mg2+/Co2+ transporter CorC
LPEVDDSVEINDFRFAVAEIVNRRIAVAMASRQVRKPEP